jgi:hypothetical protein
VTTLFEPGPAAALLDRLERLTRASQPQWGKMDVAQMLCHVTRTLESATGAFSPPRLPWPVRMIGRLVKRRALGDAPFARNSPTSPAFKVVDAREFAAEKAGFVAAFRVLADGSPHQVTASDHVFFGPMTRADWGRLMYKHIDHHFRQFGV